MKRIVVKRVVVATAWFALLAIGAYATERAHNNYRTHRIDPNTVLFSCEDEHEPSIRKFENTTLVMISCEKK